MSESNVITTDARRERGMRIADRMRIQRQGGTWVVPSESKSDTKYSVHLENGGRCTCPDHYERGVKCKHQWAVEFTIRRETNERGEVTETRTVRATYSQEWTAYNAAQTTEKDRFAKLLADLCALVPEPNPQTTGRPRLPMSDMAFAAVYKVYSTVSGRRFMCDLRDAHERGYVSQLPHYNSIFNYMDMDAMTPILRDLVIESALPLREVESDFAIDSSGFSTSHRVTWYDKKYGDWHAKSHWLKAHIACGVTTNVVTAVEISAPNEHDSPFFAPLVAQTSDHFQIAEVSADKAYSSFANLALVDDMGAAPFIPFKRQQGLKPNSPRAWEKMYRYFRFRQDDFMAHYHKRSNVETTFSMIKRKFGGTLRSKSDIGMVNELLAKVVAHNLCCLNHAIHELGIAPVFWQPAKN